MAHKYVDNKNGGIISNRSALNLYPDSCGNCGINKFKHLGTCEQTLNHFISLHSSTSSTPDVRAIWETRLKALEADNLIRPNSAPTFIQFTFDTIKQEHKSGCDCGAHKVYGVGKGAVGHSSWCSWK